MTGRREICVLIATALLFITCGIAAAQTLAKPVLIDTIGDAPNGDVRGRLDIFFVELSRSPGSRGLIITYGNPKKIVALKTLIQHHVSIRKQDPTKLSIIVGGNVSVFHTDLWLIPKGAEPPKIEPEAKVVIEFGSATKTQVDRFVRSYFRELSNVPNNQGYIVNYGSDKEIARREKWIIDAMSFRHVDRSRITLVRGGPKRPPGTVMWLLPSGAKNPLV